jgi:hypothetical protein
MNQAWSVNDDDYDKVADMQVARFLPLQHGLSKQKLYDDFLWTVDDAYRAAKHGVDSDAYKDAVSEIGYQLRRRESLLGRYDEGKLNRLADFLYLDKSLIKKGYDDCDSMLECRLRQTEALQADLDCNSSQSDFDFS